MRSSIAMATFMALAAGTVGAGAIDSVPHMVGSDTLKNLTLQVLSSCTALHTLGDPITYDGTGSGSGENAMKIVDATRTQLIAPMSRAMGTAICSVAGATRAGAEGMVVALDGVAVIVNNTTVGAEGIDYPGVAADPANQWRTVLRLIYMGMDPAVGTNVFARDCNSDARKAIVNNWDNVFHGTVTSCTDSHPSVPGAGANGYDQANAIVEPGVRHAFRRDDESGTTDVFLAQLSLSGVNFAQAAPTGSTAAQAAVYRSLAGSPFCNNKRPEDDWQPVNLAANGTLGRLACGSKQGLEFLFLHKHQLGKIAREFGDALGLVGVARIVRQMVVVLAHHHPATGGGHRNRLDLALFHQRPPGVDIAAHVVKAVLLVVEVEAHRAAAAGIAARHQRDAQLVEHARGGVVDVRHHRRLHAAFQQQHAARVARRRAHAGFLRRRHLGLELSLIHI